MRFNFSGKRNLPRSFALAIALASLIGCAKATSPGVEDLNNGEITSPIADEHGHLHDDGESIFGVAQSLTGAGCVKATAQQKAYVDYGNKLYKDFIKQCVNRTGASTWCEQLTRPNPDSAEIFACTYGEDQEHRFIHPDQSTWRNAFEAVKIIEDLQRSGIGVRRIYNWWRPEPYNKNVEGAGGRHPLGTSVDVEFDSQSDKNSAFRALCRMRSQGRIKAIGYYPTHGLHVGIDDKVPNTWGKDCR